MGKEVEPDLNKTTLFGEKALNMNAGPGHTFHYYSGQVKQIELEINGLISVQLKNITQV